MKSVLALACLATLVVYSQAAAYGETCANAADCTGANQECPAALKCACVSGFFAETLSSVTTCYKKIGEVSCATATPCHTTATCSAAGACYCPNGKTPDTNLQKCVTAGAAGIAASVLSLAVVVFTSRVL